MWGQRFRIWISDFSIHQILRKDISPIRAFKYVTLSCFLNEFDFWEYAINVQWIAWVNLSLPLSFCLYVYGSPFRGSRGLHVLFGEKMKNQWFLGVWRRLVIYRVHKEYRSHFRRPKLEPNSGALLAHNREPPRGTTLSFLGLLSWSALSRDFPISSAQAWICFRMPLLSQYMLTISINTTRETTQSTNNMLSRHLTRIRLHAST